MKVCFVYPPKQSMGKLFYPAKVWKNYSESAVSQISALPILLHYLEIKVMK